MITLWYCPLFLRHRLQSSKLKNTPLNKSEINVGFNGIRKQVRWRLYSTYTAVKNGSENFSFFVARFANTTRWSSFFPHYCHYLKSLLLCCSERCYRIEILWRSDIFCSSVEVLQKVQAMQHTVGASNATHSGSKQCNAQWEQAMHRTVGASNATHSGRKQCNAQSHRFGKVGWQKYLSCSEKNKAYIRYSHVTVKWDRFLHKNNNTLMWDIQKAQTCTTGTSCVRPVQAGCSDSFWISLGPTRNDVHI